MQAIAPLSNADFLKQIQEPLIKLEVYYEDAWQNIANLDGIGGDVLEDMTISILSSAISPEPVAATWTARVYNKEALFFTDHPTSDLTDVFIVGRRMRLSSGIKVDDTDYYWIQLTGVISKVAFTGDNLGVLLSGHDDMQRLKDYRLKHADAYWGDTTTFRMAVADYDYAMPADCNGVYYLSLNGTEVPNGDEWIYDPGGNEIVFHEDLVPADPGVDHDVIYLTDQVPEEVVADLMVLAGLYADQAAALAAMSYTATGVTLPKVWWNYGTSALTAIKHLCERVDYRFWMGYDSTPNFEPKPSEADPGSEDLVLTEDQVGDYSSYKNDVEMRNLVTVEGDVKHVPLWRNVPVAEEVLSENRFRDTSSDAALIAIHGEKSLHVSNHLFQSLAACQALSAALLIEFKGEKKYITFNLEFMPFPVQLYDTIKIQRRLTHGDGAGGIYGLFRYAEGFYGDDGIIIAQAGLVRDIKINKFTTTLRLEED